MSSFSVSAAVLALMAIARTSCASTTTVALAFSPSPPHCRRTTLLSKSIHGKYPTHPSRQSAIIVSSSSDDDSTQNNEEAARLQQKAQELRAQIRQMESQIGEERRARYNGQLAKNPIDEEPTEGKKSLKDKRILIVGANGRLGSMVTRHLLRTHGSDVKEVVAACHYIGEATTRGYGRLSSYGRVQFEQTSRSGGGVAKSNTGEYHYGRCRCNHLLQLSLLFARISHKPINWRR